MLPSRFFSSLVLFSAAVAIPTAVREDSHIQTRTSKNKACVNGPTTRNCWTAGFDLLTDYDTAWPNGKTLSVCRRTSNQLRRTAVLNLIHSTIWK